MSVIVAPHSPVSAINIDKAHSEQFFGDTRDFWWNKAGKIKNRVKQQLLDNRYCSAGGALTYLTSGRK